jgi:hypothetical protein
MSNREPPEYKNATIVFHPCNHFLEAIKGPNPTIGEFLEERYPGWEQEFHQFYIRELGSVEAYMSLPPVTFASLGILWVLAKERLI